VRNQYQRKERKSKHKLELVGRQELSTVLWRAFDTATYAYYRHAAKLKMLCLEGSRSGCGGRGRYANSIEREWVWRPLGRHRKGQRPSGREEE
jgi:hypothetical protein